MNSVESRDANTAAHQTVASYGLFDGNSELLSEFKTRKSEIADSHSQYLADHPELRAFLADYMQLLMHRKPEDVYAFTLEYFKP
ncbi:hypothetical protein BC831DRAFT_195191 [Entophlyctis helioformis]|nr:hypothetical protein BC831DRAFT_195191 [Entophlyctis helioformis]